MERDDGRDRDEGKRDRGDGKKRRYVSERSESNKHWGNDGGRNVTLSE